MNAWEKYKQDREKRKQEETEKFSGSSAWETYKAGRKAEAEQPASSPVRKTMLAAEKDGFQRENLYEDSVGETSLSYEELADMTLQERLARSQLGQQEAAKNMLKDAGYVGERFGLGVATGLEGLADAAILAKAQGLLDSPSEKTGKAIADLLGIRKKTTEELMAENLAKQALANQATAPWQASIEDRYDPNRVTETVGEIGQTIGNMAPSIVGNILLPGIGIPVMGVAAGGQGAQQAYQETADLKKATLYGMATGGLEAGTELLFGGLAGLGKGVADTAVGKVVKKAASALGDSKAGKVISGFANSPVVKAVADSLGEGVEEVIATYLDPFLQRVIYNPNAQNATAEELLQSGLMGMLVGGVFQAGNAALGGLMGEGYVPPEQVEPEINEMDTASAQPEQDINAVDNQPEQPHLTNSQVERMIRDEATMQEMGIDTNGKTMSQLRAEVRAKLAAQEQGAETSSEESGAQTPAQETASTTNPAVAEETQAEQVVNTRTEGITNGEEVYLRNGSQRAGSANPGGQVSAVEESTGRSESGQAERQLADRGAASLTYGERVSTNSLGIGGGSIKNTIRILKDGDTQYTAEAKRIAKERGLRVTFFTDDNLSIRQSNGEFASVRGYISGDRVFIRADHPLYTADQIMRHEVGHDMIAKGEVDVKEVRRRIKQGLGRKTVRQVSSEYARAYEGTGMTAEEIWEEVICDSLGDMNIFSGKIEADEAGVYLTHTKEAAQPDAAENRQERGPPNEKTSIETLPDGKKYVRADRQVIFGNDPESWSEQLEDYINGKIRKGQNVQLVAEDGDVLTLTAHTAGKVASMYNGDGTTMSEEAFERKVNAGAHIDEIASVSVRGKNTKTDKGNRHGDMATGGWNYRTAFFQDFDKRYYRLKVSVAIGADGNAVYNIGDISERSFPQIDGSSAKGGAQNGKASYEVSMPQAETEVNRKFSRELDNAYMSAVERGDMETAQKMVDEAAKAVGYPVKAWHGTPIHGITVFDRKKIGSTTDSGIFGRGFYFTTNKATADLYATDSGETMPVYLRVKNPWWVVAHRNITEVAEELGMSEDALVLRGYGGRGKVVAPIESQTGQFASHLMEHGYNSVVIQHGKNNYEVVVFDSNDVKSADPVTYDDNGNVIPLSERFNPENDDIRFSMEPTSEFKPKRKVSAAEFSDATKQAIKDAQLAGMMNQGRKDAERIRKAKETTADVRRKRDDTIRKLKEHQREQKQKASESRKVNAAEFSETTKQAVKDAQLAGMMNQGRKDARTYRKLEEQMERERMMYQAREEEIRKRRDDTIRKLKEHQREQKQKASESRNASAIRAKIQRHVADLSRTLRNPTDKKHVPEALRGPVAKLLESINLESKDGAPTKRTQAFNELKKVYAEISENLVIDPDLLGGEGTTGLLDDVIAMADKRIADMNTEELDTIWKTVRAIEASIRTANKAFSAGRFQTIQEAADALRSDNLFKRGKTELNYIDKLQKLTGVDMLTPEAYFHRLGKAGDAIFRMMRNAQDKHIRLMKQVADFTGENLSDVDVRALEKEMHTVRLGGQDVELSTAQLMELYALMRRQQAMEHLVEGGILPDVVSKRGLKKTAKAEPIHGVTAEELMEAVGVLTEEQVQIAELLQEYASTTLSDFGNEASMEVYGYRKFTEPHYWPIRSNRQEVRSDIQKDTQVTSVANRGFTKNVKPHANNSVMVGSIFDTFAAHSSDMATYAAWLGTSEDVNRIRNFVFRAVDEEGKTKTVGTVKGILDRVHGTNKGQQYLQKLLADIANGVKGVDVSASMTGGLLGNYKAASVGGNLRVVIQQPTAILRAFDLIDPKYFVSGSNPVRGFEKAKQYAPIAVWKDWGYFDIHTGRQMKDVLFNSESVLGKTREASMWLAGKMDSVSWGMLWNAVEAETKDKTDLNPGTEAFYQKVAERFNEVIDRTQVVDGILQRSQIMRDPGDLKKMVTSFMGEPTKQYNMLLSAVYDARNGIPGGKWALVRTSASLATAAVMNAAVQSIIDAFRDDDREQDYWEKWLEAFLGVGSEDKGAMKFLNSNVGSAVNPLGYLPYVKDAWSSIQGYDVSRMDMDSIDKTVSAASVLMKALNGKGTPTIGGAVISMLAAVGNLVGIPVANLKREITSFALTAAMESDNHLMEYRIRRVLYKVPENTTMYYDILYSAMQNDPEAYEIIYADMVRSGLGEDKIKKGMETRMKSAQGVESVADLEQRWMSPEQKGAYDTYLRRMEKSAVWGKAKADQRSAAEELLYEYVTGSADKMAEKLEDGIRYGVDETEYMLYKLALSMTDKPSENGNYGSYTNDEVKAAIDMLKLGKKESAWLWEAQGRSEKSNPYK